MSFYFFFLLLSVDFIYFYFLSPLTHLNFRCLSVQSLIELVVCPRSLISVVGCRAGHRVHLPPRGLGSGSWCFVTTLLSSLILFSLYAVVVTLFDLFFYFFIFWKLQYTFFPYSEHDKGLLLDSLNWSWTHLPIGLLCFALVAWKGNTAPFQQCGSALLILCCKWIWKVTAWLRPGVVLDRTGPNCGREAWAEECAERESGMVQ